MIDVLLEALRLKRLKRAGWVRKGVPDPESVAGHSWGVSWLVLVLLPADRIEAGSLLWLRRFISKGHFMFSYVQVLLGEHNGFLFFRRWINPINGGFRFERMSGIAS